MNLFYEPILYVPIIGIWSLIVNLIVLIAHHRLSMPKFFAYLFGLIALDFVALYIASLISQATVGLTPDIAPVNQVPYVCTVVLWIVDYFVFQHMKLEDRTVVAVLLFVLDMTAFVIPTFMACIWVEPIMPGPAP